MIKLNEGIMITGVGRYNSPGLSLKYCAYIIMEMSSGLIIGLTMLYKEYGRESATLEPMAAKSCMEEFMKEGQMIERIVSNRSSSIESELEVNQQLCTNISHELEFWYLIKTLLVKISEMKALA